MVEEVGIQPWGHPPTPIVPGVLLEHLGHLSIPARLRDKLGGCVVLRELHSDIWNNTDFVDAAVLSQIVRVMGPKLRCLAHVILRRDSSSTIRLDRLPFSARTRNAIRANDQAFSSPRLTLGDVLNVAGLGIKSAVEFACILEAVAAGANRPKAVSALKVPRPQTTPSELKSFFRLLAAYALGELHEETLSSVLQPAKDDWPRELQYLWRDIGRLRTDELGGSFANRYSVVSGFRRWAAPIDKRLQEVLVHRTFPVRERATLEQLGEKLGVTRERVRQLEKKALDHLKRLDQSDFSPLKRAAARLRLGLGMALPDNSWNPEGAILDIEPEFSELPPELAKLGTGLLVYLAGPYESANGWTMADKQMPDKVADELRNRADERGLIANDSVSNLLSTFGIQERFRTKWIAHLANFHTVEGGYIYLKGSITARARALLQYHARPLSVEEMFDSLGTKSISSARQRLLDDSGFWRINRQSQFVLAGTPGYDEYTGITDEIVQELEACGGRATVKHLVTKLTTTYGVRESSVHAYLCTPMFARDAEGLVRLRRPDEPIEMEFDITKTPACYINQDGDWCWRMRVDSAAIRGSGRMMPNAFADLLGCGIGDKLEINSNCGPVIISWPASSSAGASIGSIRQPLAELGAKDGDYVFISKKADGISFRCLGHEVVSGLSSPLCRLVLLVGQQEAENLSENIDRLSRALKVSGANDQQRLAACQLKLKTRGEEELASLVDKSKLLDESKRSVEEYIASMEELFRQ